LRVRQAAGSTKSVPVCEAALLLRLDVLVHTIDLSCMTVWTDACLPTDSLVNYVQFYYCHAKPAGYITSSLLQVACVFLLLLLFRVLGSTAENFFNPILTQLSQELGLPPRLAGGMFVPSAAIKSKLLVTKVSASFWCTESANNFAMHAVTFLALGNGAPDISSSIAAVRAGQYKMALGSLLGKTPLVFDRDICFAEWDIPNSSYLLPLSLMSSIAAHPKYAMTNPGIQANTSMSHNVILA